MSHVTKFGNTLTTSSAISPASFFLLPSRRSYVTPHSCNTLFKASVIGFTFSFNAILELSVKPVTVNVPVDALNVNLVAVVFPVAKLPVAPVDITGYNVVDDVSSANYAPAAAQLNVPLPLLTKAYPLLAASALGKV